jgi:hypothetical protein
MTSGPAPVYKDVLETIYILDFVIKWLVSIFWVQHCCSTVCDFGTRQNAPNSACA